MLLLQLALVGFLDLQLCPTMRASAKFLYVCSLSNYAHNPYKWCDLLASGRRSGLCTHGMPTCLVSWLSGEGAYSRQGLPSHIYFLLSFSVLLVLLVAGIHIHSQTNTPRQRVRPHTCHNRNIVLQTRIVRVPLLLFPLQTLLCSHICLQKRNWIVSLGNRRTRLKSLPVFSTHIQKALTFIPSKFSNSSLNSKKFLCKLPPRQWVLRECSPNLETSIRVLPRLGEVRGIPP